MRTELKLRAVELRKLGYSYSTIRDRLNVSKSTLSEWLRDIPYRPNSETKKKMQEGQLRSALAKNKQKVASLKLAEQEAATDIGKVSGRDLFMLGLGLYIGEGAKTHSITRMVNSDPRIIKLALAWFKKGCGLTNKNFTITLHLYPDTDIEKCLIFWQDVTGLSKEQFNKVSIDTRTGKSFYKKGKLPYGTAHLYVRSAGNSRNGVFLARKIEKWSDWIYKQIHAGLV